MAKQKSQKQFLSEIKKVHGDRYDLSKVVYQGALKRISVICMVPGHGLWEPLASSFKSGHGCPKCGKERASKKKIKWTTDYLIREGTKKWNGFFNYSMTKCNGAFDTIKFECPVHGIRSQRASSHLTYGCQLCEIDKRANEKRLTKKILVKRLIDLYGHDFGYERQKIQNYYTVLSLKCPDHGLFEQSINNLLRGTACQKCGQERTVEPLRISHEEFMKKLIKIHGDNYILDKTLYTSNREKIILTCRKHGDFKITPSNALSGSGCSRCAQYGFNPGKKAVLYYYRVSTTEGKTLYKIGVTNRSPDDRFTKKDLSKMSIVAEFKFDTGQDAYEKEQDLINSFSMYKYDGKEILKDGNSELFMCDILRLDSNK